MRYYLLKNRDAAKEIGVKDACKLCHVPQLHKSKFLKRVPF